MPGGIAKNAQEGTRSEYLAQYALSSFGTCIPVPHPEDSGIDLYCTLGRRVGRRFLVENNYFVQVKSNKGEIKYNGIDEVKWLLAHKYPLFICIVNKEKAKIELYQTIALSTLIAKGNIASITLKTEKNKELDYFPTLIEQEDIDIYLGEPIVKFTITNFSKVAFNKQICKTIKSWVELDQENIDLKETGFTMYRIPEKWKVNSPVEALKFIGNFKDSQVDNKTQRKFNNLFLKLLSQLINQSASEGNINKYKALLEFVKFYTTQNKLNDSFGARILGFCVNKGNEHLGIKERINLFKQK